MVFQKQLKSSTPAKKPSNVKFDMNSALGKEIEKKLLDPTYKYVDAGVIYDKYDIFNKSGLTKTQFKRGCNRFRAKHGIIVEKSGKNKGTLKILYTIDKTSKLTIFKSTIL